MARIFPAKSTIQWDFGILPDWNKNLKAEVECLTNSSKFKRNFVRENLKKIVSYSRVYLRII